LDMGPIFQTQSNPIHKYLVLNRTRKLTRLKFEKVTVIFTGGDRGLQLKGGVTKGGVGTK